VIELSSQAFVLSIFFWISSISLTGRCVSIYSAVFPPFVPRLATNRVTAAATRLKMMREIIGKKRRHVGDEKRRAQRYFLHLFVRLDCEEPGSSHAATLIDTRDNESTSSAIGTDR
jgi:hypothetical protein